MSKVTRTFAAAALAIAGSVMAATCAGPSSPAAPSPAETPTVETFLPSTPTRPPPPAVTVVLVGAGDIGECAGEPPEITAAEATARLLDGMEGTVFTAGDNVYQVGSAEEFQTCYEPTWGRHKARTRPSPGNHDYNTPGAVPYYAYFGANAGPSGRGYYSYTYGAWKILSLNSNVAMGAGSPQGAWIQAELAADRSTCTLAYWHHPIVNSSFSSVRQSAVDVWRILYEFDVDVVIGGHYHNYERFAPMDPYLRPDPVRGIRQFIVGTGGARPHTFNAVAPNSEARVSAFGVIRLTLQPASYEWQFVSTTGGVLDSGNSACH